MKIPSFFPIWRNTKIKSIMTDFYDIFKPIFKKWKEKERKRKKGYHLTINFYLCSFFSVTYSSLNQPTVGADVNGHKGSGSLRKQDTSFSGSYMLHGLSFIIKQATLSSMDPYKIGQQPLESRHSVLVKSYLILQWKLWKCLRIIVLTCSWANHPHSIAFLYFLQSIKY